MMKPLKKTTVAALLACACISVTAYADTGQTNQQTIRSIVINKDPIQIEVPVDSEIRIEFPEALINLNIEEPANSALKTLLKPDGTLYWKATYDFENSRALATTAAGELIILDVKSSEPSNEKIIYQLQDAKAAAQSPVTIRPVNTTQGTKQRSKKDVKKATTSVTTNSRRQTPQQTQQNAAADLSNQDPYALMPAFLKAKYQGETATSKPSSAQAQKQYSYADMAAFAMQHYIGPARLIEPIPASRIKPRTPKTRLIRVWNSDLNFKMLNQWVMNKQFITALKVKNVGNTAYHFDPEAIRGNYVFVAALQGTLPPYGSINNETVWVFITNEPFYKAFANPY